MIRRRRHERGYNVLILAMAVTVTLIFVAAALPLWSKEIRREREEELIFRGLQYAEAIRLFQLRFNRLPVRLEELIEVEPRCLRQLWVNPMNEDGSWGLIVANLPPGGGGGARGTDLGGSAGADGRGAGPGAPRPGGGLVLRGGGHEARRGKPQVGRPVTTGPLQGVYSPEGGEAVKSFLGSNQVSEWRFTPELLRPAAPPPGSTQASLGAVPVNAAFVGRPFPPGVTPPSQQVPGPGGAQLPVPPNPAPQSPQKPEPKGR